MSRWFRFYADAMRNPKVLRLSDKDFRLWVRLLAVASENDGHIAAADDLKMVLAMRLDHLEGGLDRLIRGGLIDALANGYEPHGWAKFQYKSDVSTARVHKHREKRNVSETPPDTEADTEEPPNPRKRGNGGKTMIPEDWKLPAKADLPPKARACAEQWTDASYETHGEAFHGYWRSSRRMYADWTATWANRVIALHSQVMRDQKFGNAPTDVPKAANDPEAGKLFQQYQAGEITFEEFHRQREAKAPKRTASTGPPRSIGELARGVAGAAR